MHSDISVWRQLLVPEIIIHTYRSNAYPSTFINKFLGKFSNQQNTRTILRLFVTQVFRNWFESIGEN